MNTAGIAPIMLMAMIMTATTATVGGAAVLDATQGQNIQSTDPLYPLERLGENVNYALAAQKNTFLAERATERIQEYEHAALQGIEKPELKAESDAQIQTIEQNMLQQQISTQEMEQVRQRLQIHVQTLQRVRENIPLALATGGFEEAVQKSSMVLNQIGQQ